jgi:hypothetical protein
MSKDIEERLEAIEEKFDAETKALRAEIRRLHRELVARGIDVAPMDANPEKLPMSSEGLKALKRQLAARARAGKDVGSGKGKVSTVAVKRRLEKQADARGPTTEATSKPHRPTRPEDDR